jgi:hypothetical protein
MGELIERCPSLEAYEGCLYHLFSLLTQLRATSAAQQLGYDLLRKYVDCVLKIDKGRSEVPPPPHPRRKDSFGIWSDVKASGIERTGTVYVPGCRYVLFGRYPFISIIFPAYAYGLKFFYQISLAFFLRSSCNTAASRKRPSLTYFCPGDGGRS